MSAQMLEVIGWASWLLLDVEPYVFAATGTDCCLDAPLLCVSRSDRLPVVQLCVFHATLRVSDRILPTHYYTTD